MMLLAVITVALARLVAGCVGGFGSFFFLPNIESCAVAAGIWLAHWSSLS